MDSCRIARLTEKQRTCLRMVYSHMTSKEIAQRLGIEPGSVDQYIKAAIRILDVADRRAAAMMLARHEGLGAAQPLVYQPPELVPAADLAKLGPSTEGGPPERSEALVGAMREEQAAYQVAPTLRPSNFRLPLPMRGGRPDDLSLWQRLGWIFAIMLMIALAFGVFVAGLEGLSRLGQSAGS